MRDSIVRGGKSVNRWCVVFTVCLCLVLSSSPPARAQLQRRGREISKAVGWLAENRLPPQAWEAAGQNDAKWLRVRNQASRTLLSQKKNSRGKERRIYRDSSPSERNHLRNNYKQWESLPPEKRQELRRRMEKWKGLSPEERQLFRERYRQWQEISPEERQIIRRKLEEWDKLSPQERERIQQKFRNR